MFLSSSSVTQLKSTTKIKILARTLTVESTRVIVSIELPQVEFDLSRSMSSVNKNLHPVPEIITKPLTCALDIRSQHHDKNENLRSTRMALSTGKRRAEGEDMWSSNANLTFLPCDCPRLCELQLSSL